MVKTYKKDGLKKYECEVCGLIFLEKNWAYNCEQFCKKNNACSLEITSHSIQRKKK
jgi:hypothetical protein